MNNKPYLFDDVVNTITNISMEMNELVNEMMLIDEEVDTTRHEHMMKAARAWPTLTGSIADKERTVQIICEHESTAEMLARRKQIAAKRRMEYLRMAFEAARSINASKRAEFAAEPIGQFT